MMNDDGEHFAVSVVAMASTSALLGQDGLGVLTVNNAFNGLGARNSTRILKIPRSWLIGN